MPDYSVDPLSGGITRYRSLGQTIYEPPGTVTLPPGAKIIGPGVFPAPLPPSGKDTVAVLPNPGDQPGGGPVIPPDTGAGLPYPPTGGGSSSTANLPGAGPLGLPVGLLSSPLVIGGILYFLLRRKRRRA